MTYPHAAKGVKKLFTAEILSLFSVALLIVAAVLGLVAAVSVSADAEAGGMTAGAGILVSVVGMAVLEIIVFIFSIIGLVNASKDEPSFQIALYALIAGVVMAVIGFAFRTANPTVYQLMEILGKLADLIVIVYVVQGIRNLAKALHRYDIERQSKTLFIVITIVILLECAAQLITLLFGGEVSAVVVNVLNLIGTIVTLVRYILYLIYLAKAKTMLAAQ